MYKGKQPKNHKFALIFQGLFVGNITVQSTTRKGALFAARQLLVKRYPVKHKQVRLRKPYEPYIPEYDEPKGKLVRMIGEGGYEKLPYNYKTYGSLIEKIYAKEIKSL